MRLHIIYYILYIIYYIINLFRRTLGLGLGSFHWGKLTEYICHNCLHSEKYHLDGMESTQNMVGIPCLCPLFSKINARPTDSTIKFPAEKKSDWG